MSLPRRMSSLSNVLRANQSSVASSQRNCPAGLKNTHWDSCGRRTSWAVDRGTRVFHYRQMATKTPGEPGRRRSRVLETSVHHACLRRGGGADGRVIRERSPRTYLTDAASLLVSHRPRSCRPHGWKDDLRTHQEGRCSAAQTGYGFVLFHDAGLLWLGKRLPQHARAS